MTNQPITDQQLNEIEQRADAAAEGPWTVELEQCDCSDGYCHHGTYVSAVYADGVRRTEMGDFTDADWQFVIRARTDVPALLAEIRRLRAELATARSDALTAGADAIDDMEHRNAWAGRPVTASTCSEFLRGMAAGSQPASEDTLPAWLYQRFSRSRPNSPAWERLMDEDRSYWEHQARAVRRAVARGGFREPAVSSGS